MSDQFTAGPWCLSPNKTHVRKTLHGHNIASLNENLYEYQENAHLIAAAPELLASLREMLAIVEEWQEPEANEELVRAVRAIAKAEGRHA